MQLDNTLIVAILSLIGTLFGSYLSNSKTRALMEYRLNELEKKQDKHNSVIERTYKIEKDLSTAFVRIDELKEAVNEIKKEM